MSTSTFTVYRSNDASAPVLTGATGTLLGLLDAVLVNGYGSKTAAGWSKPFVNSSSVGCYKQGAGAGLNLSVNDAGPGVGTFKEARMTGYETLSAVATGTNPFPTSAQGVGSVAMVVCRKSTTADSTARPWVVYADASTFYLFVQTGDTASTYHAFAFGDFYSFVSGDSWRCMIIGRSTENSGTASVEKLDSLSALNTAVSGHFVVRNYGGTVGSITVGKHGDGVKGSTTALIGTIQYTNGADTGTYTSPVWLCENSTSTIRGQLRGFYQMLHAVSNFTDAQTFTGGGAYAGKTFQAVLNSGNSGMYLLETSATVLTN